jgi:hypothetical protein
MSALNTIAVASLLLGLQVAVAVADGPPKLDCGRQDAAYQEREDWRADKLRGTVVLLGEQAGRQGSRRRRPAYTVGPAGTVDTSSPEMTAGGRRPRPSQKRSESAGRAFTGIGG